MDLDLFVTDLDNTLVGDDLTDDRSTIEINQLLSQYRQQYGTKIVYVTGRSPLLYRQLQAEKNLLTPDALVVAVGTEIYYDGKGNNDSIDIIWSQQINQKWDREKVAKIASQFPALFSQPESEQRPFKVSYFISETEAKVILPQLKKELKDCGLDVEIIYSGSQDLDILPSSADKGKALQFLRQKWQISSESTLVCGDSGNDIALFRNGKQKGIIVGNARSELLNWHELYPNSNRYLAKSRCAMGILEGMKHFGW